MDTTTRRRSRPRTQSWVAAAASACTRRAGARGAASSASPSREWGRLALESGVPVVPVAIHGSSSIRRWRKLRFPKVTVQYGEPISFQQVENPTTEQQLEASTKIFDRVREMYVALEEHGRRGVIKALRERVGSRSDAKLPAGSPSSYS